MFKHMWYNISVCGRYSYSKFVSSIGHYTKNQILFVVISLKDLPSRNRILKFDLIKMRLNYFKVINFKLYLK